MSVLLKCLSHSPLRGLNDPDEAIVKEVNTALLEARKEVEQFDPELIVFFGPDHYNGLFYDLMPPFVVAAAATAVGDFGSEAGPLPIPGDLALSMTQHILNEDIDIAFSQRLLVDHGCAQVLQDMAGRIGRYPVIPIIINSVAPPFAPYRRVRQLGEAVGRYIKTLNKRVLILASGGLSHEPPVPVLTGAVREVSEFLIAGRNPSKEARAVREARVVAAAKKFGTVECTLTPLNAEWDRRFMQLLRERRLHEVDDFDIDTISKEAGRSTHEVRTWIAAFSALAVLGDYQAQTDFYRAINEWIAGYGVMSASLVNTQ